METYSTDCVIIGAGVIGLAIGRALAQAGREVIVLEAAGAIGTGISSRNSEVIHAGLYYPPGSLKAQACVEGRRALYDYARTRGVPHRQCGKLVVACSGEEAARLEAIASRARENGVEGVALIDGDQARRLEPALHPGVEAALLSPETGIIDSHALMLSLLGEMEAAGGRLALSAPFLRAEAAPGRFRIETGGTSPVRLEARCLVNAAGLDAERVARATDGLDDAHIPVLRYAKGSYFSLAGRSPFERLIYPAPIDGGLGVHLTFDMGGAMRFGPDVEWDAAPDDLAVDPGRAAGFAEAVGRYWTPPAGAVFQPDYAGMRPKLSGPGEPAADFRIDGAGEHGLDGLVNLFGIESPGLTACLQLAVRVTQLA